MSNIAIKVENLSKRYRIGLKDEMHDTLFGAITSWIKSPLSNLRQLTSDLLGTAKLCEAC